MHKDLILSHRAIHVNKQNKDLGPHLVFFNESIITGLPAFQGQTVILVMVDRFSKATHFGTLPTYFSGCKTADLFMQMICKLHGYPRSIISDRDPILSANLANFIPTHRNKVKNEYGCLLTD